VKNEEKWRVRLVSLLGDVSLLTFTDAAAAAAAAAATIDCLSGVF
jgi:hypothetical protein